MISGFILAFTLSIDDFAVTIFTIGNEGLETLSTYIYADARKGGLTPELRPLSTIIFVTVLVLLIVINNTNTVTKIMVDNGRSSGVKPPLRASA